MSAELLQSVSHEEALQFALSGGDDYELCFTSANTALLACGMVAGVPVRRIGQVGSGDGLSCTQDGAAFPYHNDGYRHFR